MKKVLPVLWFLFIPALWIQAQTLHLQTFSTVDPIIYDLNLNWTGTANDSVGVYYSSDNGASYSLISYAVTKANGTGQYLMFTDALTNSQNAKVKLVKVGDPSDFAESVSFRMQRAIVTYTTALSGVTFHPGQTVPISVSVNSYIPCSLMELYFSKDNGQTWQLLSAGNATDFVNYQWTVPTITSRHCLFGVWNGWNFQYIKSPLFKIINPADPYGNDLTISSPANGDVLKAGEPLTVTWDTTGLANRSLGIMVREQYPPYQNNCLIGLSNSRAGKANIKVPYLVGNNYVVYIYSMNNGTPLIASSSGSFRIIAPNRINNKFIDILPPATTNVPRGSTVTFNWNSYPGLDLVGVSRKYPNSINNPVPVNLNNLANTGTYSFTAPSQAFADIEVELTPYIQTASILSGGCAEKYKITFRTTDVTGVEEQKELTKNLLIPNPTSGQFQVSDPKRIREISIWNTMGEEIFRQKYENPEGIRLDVSAFPKGVYFVAVRKTEGSFTTKLVKE